MSVEIISKEKAMAIQIDYIVRKLRTVTIPENVGTACAYDKGMVGIRMAPVKTIELAVCFEFLQDQIRSRDWEIDRLKKEIANTKKMAQELFKNIMELK